MGVPDGGGGPSTPPPAGGDVKVVEDFLVVARRWLRAITPIVSALAVVCGAIFGAVRYAEARFEARVAAIVEQKVRPIEDRLLALETESRDHGWAHVRIGGDHLAPGVAYGPTASVVP